MEESNACASGSKPPCGGDGLVYVRCARDEDLNFLYCRGKSDALKYMRKGSGYTFPDCRDDTWRACEFTKCQPHVEPKCGTLSSSACGPSSQRQYTTTTDTSSSACATTYVQVGSCEPRVVCEEQIVCSDRPACIEICEQPTKCIVMDTAACPPTCVPVEEYTTEEGKECDKTCKICGQFPCLSTCPRQCVVIPSCKPSCCTLCKQYPCNLSCPKRNCGIIRCAPPPCNPCIPGCDPICCYLCKRNPCNPMCPNRCAPLCAPSCCVLCKQNPCNPMCRNACNSACKPVCPPGCCVLCKQYPCNPTCPRACSDPFTTVCCNICKQTPCNTQCPKYCQLSSNTVCRKMCCNGKQKIVCTTRKPSYKLVQSCQPCYQPRGWPPVGRVVVCRKPTPLRRFASRVKCFLLDG